MNNKERFTIHSNELEKIEFYLPLGTILSINNNEQIMIVGYQGVSKELNNKVFDYIGCTYPEGINDNNSLLLFNKEQITKIYSIGYIHENLENKIK